MQEITRTLSSALLETALQYPVVTLTGPRQSGKTTLVQTLFPHCTYVNLEQMDTRTFAKTDPVGFFKTYKPPLILDEIQNCPELLSQVQVESDLSKKDGQFILTGSCQLALFEAITQSLAGRTALMTLLPFSLKELSQSGINLSRDRQILNGTMPRVYAKKLNPTPYYRDYIKTYVERDVRSLLNIKNLHKFEVFLQLLAGRIGQLVNLSALSADTGVSSTTLAEWLSVLEASYVIFRLSPWHTNIGKRLTKSPKLYFTDTGVACALLGIDNAKLLYSHPLRGGLFENMVVLEALKKKYNNNATPNLFFFRTEAGLEIDLLDVHGTELFPYEIKSAESFTADFLKPLARFKQLFPQAHDGTIIYSGTQLTFSNNIQAVPFAKTADCIH